MDKYYRNENPKCPYCDHDIDIHDNNLYHLYDEDEHLIKCPQCKEELSVYSVATWAFSTSKTNE